MAQPRTPGQARGGGIGGGGGCRAGAAASVRHARGGQCGSKPVHAAKGYCDGCDAFIIYDPCRTNTTVWDVHCGSYWSDVFTFECLEPEGWIDQQLLAFPGHPHAAARCPGAIDAVCLMYTNTKYTKEAMFPHTGTGTLNEFIMVAGQCTSDNLPPRICQIQYSWRAPTLAIHERIFRVLESNARHSAEVTGCNVSVRWVTKTRPGLANHGLAGLTHRNLELVGQPRYNEDARALARAVHENLGIAPMEDPFTEDCQRLYRPQEYEADLRSRFYPWQRNLTTDDYVKYIWIAATERLYSGRPLLNPPSPGHMYSAWVSNALGGVRVVYRPRHLRGWQDYRSHVDRPADAARGAGEGPGRVQQQDRGRCGRHRLGSAPAAIRFSSTGGPALAGVRAVDSYTA